MDDRTALSLLPPGGSVLSTALSLEVTIIQLSQVEDQLLCVLSCEGRYWDDPLGHVAPEGLQVAPGPWQVHFVGHYGVGPIGQTRLILIQLIAQLV